MKWPGCSETLGPVVVGVDTSGGIDAATLAAFAPEISAIMDEAAPDCPHGNTPLP